jgi:putative peptide maturation dehydrogenase
LIPRARRAAQLFFRLSDELFPDFARLLRGEMGLASHTRLLALSTLTGRELAISLDEYRALEALPSAEWTAVEDLSVEPERLHRLALDGIVVCDTDEEPLAELRRRDDRLRASGWNPYAALYHSLTKWRDVDVGLLFESAPPSRSRLPPPPPHFHVSPTAEETVELPRVLHEEGLFQALSERRTTRSFHPAQKVTIEELAAVLYYTFGCHGFARVSDDVVLLKKTSPSGGSLHPIEAYPLVVGVEGIASGIYHYRADRHALEVIRALEHEAAREELVRFAAGQTYLSSAHVLVVLTSRFSRSFWKYGANSRAYSVVLMDAAHLVQTLYLVCGALGLGAFVSAAVNAANVEESLGLDGIDEGALAVCGFGRPAPERSAFDLEFEPYVPRETEV